MIGWDVLEKLMNSFDRSFINRHGEFIAHNEANQYFTLKNCDNELDVKCKVIEWFSRGAYKTEPFGANKNKVFHKFMLDGINSFLETNFTYDNMEIIYTYLGNACNHEKTVMFVNGGYDLNTLKEREQKW